MRLSRRKKKYLIRMVGPADFSKEVWRQQWAKVQQNLTDDPYIYSWP